jgi:hypothetical protein
MHMHVYYIQICLFTSSAYVSIRQHTPAYVSIRQHTSAYVSIRQHTSAYVSIQSPRCFKTASCSVSSADGASEKGREKKLFFICCPSSAAPFCTCIRQHMSAYVSIRQHATAYVSMRQHTSAYVSMRQHALACVSIRQHASAYVSMRRHTVSSNG